MHRLLSILLVFLLFCPVLAHAAANEQFVWSEEAADGKLNVCYHRSLNSEWREWAAEAMNAWNDRESETGWSLEVVPFTKDRCEVFLLVQDISEKNFRGFRIDPVDVLEGQDEPADGRLNGITVVLDAHLELTSSWMNESDDVEGGSRDGWSTMEGEATLDPIDTLMHVFGHAMRIEHSVGHDPFSPDADMTDPRKPGEHHHTLSGEDVRRAAETSQEGSALQTETILSNRAAEFIAGDVVLSIPAYAFGRARSYDVSLLEADDVAPLPMNVPSGMSHIVSAFGVFAEADIIEPLTVTLAYSDEDLAAHERTLSLTEGFYAPGLLEESLTIVRYVKETWDLTPVETEGNPSYWETVLGAEFDVEANTVTFDVSEPGYYAITGTADSQKPSEHPGYLRVQGDRVQDERDIEMTLFYKSLWEAVFRQLPAFILGLLIGVLAANLFARKKALRAEAQVESDGESVADVE